MMKKTIKNSVVALIMVILLLSLAGCGGDKITATMSDDDFEMKMEISFKDDLADKVKMTIEAPSKEEAKESVDEFKEEFGEKAKVKTSGKKVIIETDLKDMFNEMGISSVNDDDLTKENVIEALEMVGFEVEE